MARQSSQRRGLASAILVPRQRLKQRCPCAPSETAGVNVRHAGVWPGPLSRRRRRSAFRIAPSDDTCCGCFAQGGQPGTANFQRLNGALACLHPCLTCVGLLQPVVLLSLAIPVAAGSTVNELAQFTSRRSLRRVFALAPAQEELPTRSLWCAVVESCVQGAHNWPLQQTAALVTPAAWAHSDTCRVVLGSRRAKPALRAGRGRS